jgi:hypothetical protein
MLALIKYIFQEKEEEEKEEKSKMNEPITFMNMTQRLAEIARTLLEVFNEPFSEKELLLPDHEDSREASILVLLNTLKGDLKGWLDHKEGILHAFKASWILEDEDLPWFVPLDTHLERFRYNLIVDIVARASLILLYDMNGEHQLEIVQETFRRSFNLLHRSMGPIEFIDFNGDFDIADSHRFKRTVWFEDKRSLTFMAYYLRDIVMYFPHCELWLHYIYTAFPNYPQPSFQIVPYALPYRDKLGARPSDFTQILADFPKLMDAFNTFLKDDLKPNLSIPTELQSIDMAFITPSSPRKLRKKSRNIGPMAFQGIDLLDGYSNPNLYWSGVPKPREEDDLPIGQSKLCKVSFQPWLD